MVASNKQLAADLTKLSAELTRFSSDSDFKNSLNIEEFFEKTQKAQKERTKTVFSELTNQLYKTYKDDPEKYVAEIKKVSDKQVAMEIYLRSTLFEKIVGVTIKSLEKQCQDFSLKILEPNSSVAK